MKEAATRSQRARGLLIPLDDHEALIALRDFDRRIADAPAGAEDAPGKPGGETAEAA
jgi:hypothetical protein